MRPESCQFIVLVEMSSDALAFMVTPSLVIARHVSAEAISNLNPSPPKLVVRPFRVVHGAKAPHHIFELCSVILPFDF